MGEESPPFLGDILKEHFDLLLLLIVDVFLDAFALFLGIGGTLVEEPIPPREMRTVGALPIALLEAKRGLILIVQLVVTVNVDCSLPSLSPLGIADVTLATVGIASPLGGTPPDEAFPEFAINHDGVI